MTRLTGEELVAQIARRLTNGFPSEYPDMRRRVEEDYATMQHEAFDQKYANQIDGVVKKPEPLSKKAVKVSAGSPRKAKVLSPEKKAEKEAKDLQEKRERNERMLKNNPPNRSFFAYTNMTDSQWHRLDALPSEEELKRRESIVWTAGMMSAFDPRIVLKAMHFDARVIEFEYQYRGEGDDIKAYNPFF